MEYADGTREELPITYGGNISWHGRRQNEPFAAMYYRHNGYSATWTVDSTEVRGATCYRWEWLNPHPEKPIRTLRLTPAPSPVGATIGRPAVTSADPHRTSGEHAASYCTPVGANDHIGPGGCASIGPYSPTMSS